MFQVGDKVLVRLENVFGEVLAEIASPILAVRRDPILLRQEYQVQINFMQTAWVEEKFIKGGEDAKGKA